MTISLAAVQGRVADRSPGLMAGARLLAQELGKALNLVPSYWGTPGTSRICSWQDDLETARPLLQAVAKYLERALVARQTSLLCLNQCAVSLATLPVLARLRPDAVVLWLDAHGDFNTPDTTPTEYLNGLPLAGACGYWNTGFGGDLRTERLIHVGGRDFDPPELDLLTRAGITLIPSGADCASRVLAALGNAPVYLHLDWDVLEPGYVPSEYQIPDGLRPAELQSLLDGVSMGREIVGLELAEFDAPTGTKTQQEAMDVILELLSPIIHRL